MQIIIYKITLSCLIFFIFEGCGIEYFPVLSAPEKGITSDGDHTFQFIITEENRDPDDNSKFMGFEIYYRFFSQINPPTSSDLSYQSIDQLTANNFRRVTYYISDSDCDRFSDYNSPLVKVPYFPAEPNGDTRHNSTFIINFSELLSNNEPYIEIPTLDDYYAFDTSNTDNGSFPDKIPSPAKLIIRRAVQYTPDKPGFCKPFNKAGSTDEDLKDVDINNPVIIVLYIFSYGKFLLSTPLYSTTVCLLSITISLPLE